MIGLGEEPRVLRTRGGAVSPASPACPTGSSRSITAMPRCSSIITGRNARFIPIPAWKSPAQTSSKTTSIWAACSKRTCPAGRPGSTTWVDQSSWSTTNINWDVGATLFRSAHWRCVWFDPIVAVFVHDSHASVVNAHAVDFAARHFRPDPGVESRSLAELKASAKAFRSYAPAVSPPGGALGRPFYWLGIDDARRVLHLVPDSSEAWKLLGQIELFRAFPTSDARSPRFRASFDPVLDLSMVRATYALRRARSWHRATFQRCYRCGWPMISASCMRLRFPW